MLWGLPMVGGPFLHQTGPRRDVAGLVRARDLPVDADLLARHGRRQLLAVEVPDLAKPVRADDL